MFLKRTLLLIALCSLGACSSSTSSSNADDVPADLIVRNLLGVPITVVVDIPAPVSATLTTGTCQVLPLEVPAGKSELVAVTDSAGATLSYSVGFGTVGVWSLAVGGGGLVPLGAVGQVSVSCQ